ncbi:hypothetical protein [Rhizobacter sp. LjRoot28]|jgi:hypothetical protein|uniref:hypothetical protein n=1 Tax=Rhizobacter sp. LjRoot28 TaxID=3342309 RepID=UPI003ECE667C
MQFHHEQSRHTDSQFARYLAQRERRPSSLQGMTGQTWLAAGSGTWLARLMAHDLRVVQRFDDHAWVADRLAAAGELETLFRVAASGLLHGVALRFYRLALAALLEA